MNHALQLLIWLNLKGWLRFLLNGLKTIRGMLAFVIFLIVFMPYFFILLFMPEAGGIAHEDIRLYGPALLFLYVISNLTLTSSLHPLYFSPPEIQFLFPGPFIRRELLIYKVVMTLLASLPLSVSFGTLFRVKNGWFPGVFLGILLLNIFILLFAIVLGLLSSIVGAKIRTWSRWTIGIMAVLGISAIGYTRYQANENLSLLSWDYSSLAFSVLHSPTWKVISWPLASFFDLVTATSWAQLPLPLLIGLILNGLVLWAIFGFDAAFEEQAAKSSALIYARILRTRGIKSSIEPLSGSETPTSVTLFLLPYWGGIGPIVWRQSLSAIRSWSQILLATVSLSGLIGILSIVGSSKVESHGLIAGMSIGLFHLLFFLPMILPFDFRGDVDQIAMLKTLPISPWSMAVGQIVIPSLCLTFIGWMTLLFYQICFTSLVNMPLIACSAIALPFLASYVIATENVLFLFFPVRIGAASPGDFQAMGRNFIQLFKKMLCMIVPAMALIFGLIAGSITGSVWLGLFLGCFLILCATSILVVLAGYAFIWFDVSRINVE